MGREGVGGGGNTAHCDKRDSLSWQLNAKRADN